jgi:hypothetical protein
VLGLRLRSSRQTANDDNDCNDVNGSRAQQRVEQLRIGDEKAFGELCLTKTLKGLTALEKWAAFISLSGSKNGRFSFLSITRPCLGSGS